ncbi:NACHT domain-containing protein [Rhodococcus sp. IEGM 1370]|uniref:NACHT domain-containing protein n=1 Tax=Rhodococcus sp. IEGM 1370 TaxID=3082222 RepID=UPI002953D5A1|nr:NACHT domain-containing protein [Rhodococcus sp. IEGM 1370]MDV8075224.1 NACHT domain-containing protein [Rhodococcus sp. IEGM 1370]
MIETVAAVIASKVAFGAISAGAGIGTKSVWKKISNTRKVSLPSVKQLEPVNAWFVAQLEHALPNDTLQREKIESYLCSRDFLTLSQHAFIFLLAGRSVKSNAVLNQSMTSGLSLHGFESEEDSGTLFNIFSTTCEMIYEIAAQDEKDIPTSTLDSANFVISAQYLASIDEQLRRLEHPTKATFDEIKVKVEAFNKSVITVCDKITPPNLDGADPVPMDGLFVAPELTEEIQGDEGNSDWTIERLQISHRTVIVGDPGGGKTTLTRKLARDMALNYSNPKVEKANLAVPFRVVLRDFGAWFDKESGSVLEYLALSSKKDFQVEVNIDVVQFLLDSGRLYLIFDGLDELLDPQSRKKIAETIDVFCCHNPLVNVLVTSRRIGYDHNPLDPSVFTRLDLGKLSEQSVKTYVTNWFNLLPDGKLEQKSDLIARFMEESAHADDLRTNPLMLGLMCTLYRRESYIPRSRPDLYEKCSKLLFEMWDKRRNLFTPLRFDAYVRPTLAYVANSIYENQEFQSGVTERKLVSLASAYLSVKAFRTTEEAELAAAELVEFCKGRTWVLTEVGLSPTDEPIFQFSHRTFLEYFTAVHLTRTSSNIDILFERIHLGIASGDLDVVAELALQLKTRDTDGDADYFIRRIILQYTESSDEAARNTLAQFVSRALSYSLIEPSTIEEVCIFVFQHVLQGFVTFEPDVLNISGNSNLFLGSQDSDKFLDSSISSRHAIAETLCSQSMLESRVQVRSISCQYFGSLLGKDPVDQRSLESLSAYSFKLPQLFGYEKPEDYPEDLQNLHLQASAILQSNKAKWPWAAVGLYYNHLVPIADLLRDFPLNTIFQGPRIPATPIRYFAPAVYELRKVFYETNGRSASPIFEEYPGSLDACAEHILSNYPFKISVAGDSDLGMSPSSIFRVSEDFGTVPLRQLTDVQLRQACTVLAALCEQENHRSKALTRTFKAVLKATKSPDVQAMCELVLARADNEAQTVELVFDDDRGILKSWSNNKIAFLTTVDDQNADSDEADVPGFDPVQSESKKER